MAFQVLNFLINKSTLFCAIFGDPVEPNKNIRRRNDDESTSNRKARLVSTFSVLQNQDERARVVSEKNSLVSSFEYLFHICCFLGNKKKTILLIFQAITLPGRTFVIKPSSNIFPAFYERPKSCPNSNFPDQAKIYKLKDHDFLTGICL